MSVIARLRAIHEAATPGPWFANADGEPFVEQPQGRALIESLLDGADNRTDWPQAAANVRAIAVEHSTYAALLDVAEATTQFLLREADFLRHTEVCLSDPCGKCEGLGVGANEAQERVTDALAALEAAVPAEYAR